MGENKSSHRKITMTHTQPTCINCIALRAGKKGARPAEVGALVSVFEKSATELKQQTLLKCKQTILGNPPKVTHEPITRIISKKLDTKLGPFMLEELDSVLRKIKNREAAGLDEIPPELWKTRQFDDILLRHCNAVYNQNPIDR